jgi:transcriptional regulator with XRE-family HTH domain
MAGNFSWGLLIVQLRHEQKVTQRQLAVRAKVNRSTLRRIEAGQADGDMKVMERILQYLGHELDAVPSGTIHDRLIYQAQIEIDPNKRSKIALNRLLTMA